ncbi:Uncharacterized protein dnm_003630 [Desulfonema magnum]|uniref:Uncharacterized protein n=1 Tax=Desulfonema magnum TaxID=45655 RepID=A0A975BFR3_9BACT|nr:Uncharacterized protein dnm_003630 [Desulfonema magnum]
MTLFYIQFDKLNLLFYKIIFLPLFLIPHSHATPWNEINEIRCR